MLPLNKLFWSLDQNGLFKVSLWNDFFRSEFVRNLDMAPKDTHKSFGIFFLSFNFFLVASSIYCVKLRYHWKAKGLLSMTI